MFEPGFSGAQAPDSHGDVAELAVLACVFAPLLRTVAGETSIESLSLQMSFLPEGILPC